LISGAFQRIFTDESIMFDGSIFLPDPLIYIVYENSPTVVSGNVEAWKQHYHKTPKHVTLKDPGVGGSGT
jgi:hypothetical protein